MSVQNKYLEFHRLKKEIVNKLNSISDGCMMQSLCDDFMKDITVGDRVDEIVDTVDELQRLALNLSISEGN